MRRRSRRGRVFLFGLMFIVYSAINVYSASDVTTDSSNIPRSDGELNDYTTVSSKPSSISDDIPAPTSTLDPLQSSTASTKCTLSHIHSIRFEIFMAIILFFISVRHEYKRQPAKNVSAKAQLYTASYRTVPAAHTARVVPWERRPNHPCSNCHIHLPRLGHCLRWLFRLQFGSHLWRIAAVSRCGRSNIHGCRFASFTFPLSLSRLTYESFVFTENR